VIAADPERLADFYKALTGKPLVTPVIASVLQPVRPHAGRLRRVCAQICRLAQTQPKMLEHPEVARAIEQALLQTLTDCLSTASIRQEAEPRPGCPAMMIKLEEVLDEHALQLLRMADLRRLIGVSDRSLRLCCDIFLGVTPLQYLRLRLLKRVRQVLRDADPSAADIGEVAAYHGFNQPARFANLYQATFGEPPSATLQRSPDPDVP
jgi:AraC-like DNA-binding protein